MRGTQEGPIEWSGDPHARSAMRSPRETSNQFEVKLTEAASVNDLFCPGLKPRSASAAVEIVAASLCDCCREPPRWMRAPREHAGYAEGRRAPTRSRWPVR